MSSWDLIRANVYEPYVSDSYWLSRLDEEQAGHQRATLLNNLERLHAEIGRCSHPLAKMRLDKEMARIRKLSAYMAEKGWG